MTKRRKKKMIKAKFRKRRRPSTIIDSTLIMMIKVIAKLFKPRFFCAVFLCFGIEAGSYGMNTTLIEDKHDDNDDDGGGGGVGAVVPTTELKSVLGHHSAGPMLEDLRSQRVNEFWLQLDPPSQLAHYIFGVIYCIIFVVGCGGNLFVIIMFCRARNLLTPATILVLNLAVSDFIMLSKCPIVIYNSFLEGPATGDIGCRMFGFLDGLSGTASILTSTAIAVDRYYVVVHPMRAQRNRNQFGPKMMIIIIWIYSFIFAIIPALNIGLSVYVPEDFLTTCNFDYFDKSFKARAFMFTFFVCAYVIPLNIILFSYFCILKVVFYPDRVQANENRNKVEQRLAVVVVLDIFLWFIAWTPYSIVAMMGVFGYEDHITPFGSMVPALLCKTAACINPHIYATTHPRFRMEFQRFVHQSFELRQRTRTDLQTYAIVERSIGNWPNNNNNSSGNSICNINSNINSSININNNSNRPKMVNLLYNVTLAAVAEEEIIEEESIEAVATAEVHNVDNCRH